MDSWCAEGNSIADPRSARYGAIVLKYDVRRLFRVTKLQVYFCEAVNLSFFIDACRLMMWIACTVRRFFVVFDLLVVIYQESMYLCTRI